VPISSVGYPCRYRSGVKVEASSLGPSQVGPKIALIYSAVGVKSAAVQSHRCYHYQLTASHTS
jgi:hypothetical protein